MESQYMTCTKTTSGPLKRTESPKTPKCVLKWKKTGPNSQVLPIVQPNFIWDYGGGFTSYACKAICWNGTLATDEARPLDMN
eukprot:1015351-Amphidinium_carterae.1